MFRDFHETLKLGRYIYVYKKYDKIFGQLNNLFSMNEFLHPTQRFKRIFRDFIKIR